MPQVIFCFSSLSLFFGHEEEILELTNIYFSLVYIITPLCRFMRGILKGF